MKLASRELEADDIASVQELYHSRGWTDGLPIVPPSADAVQACLEWAMMSPDQLIGIEPVRGRAITAEKIAVNAVMAGCLPMHFPIVATAWSAMLQEQFLLHGATASTGGCAVLLVLNGAPSTLLIRFAALTKLVVITATAGTPRRSEAMASCKLHDEQLPQSPMPVTAKSQLTTSDIIAASAGAL